MGRTGSFSCYRHSDRATGISCTRCGRPICPECMVPASVGFQCPECVRAGSAGVRPVRGGRLQAAQRRFGAVPLVLVALNLAVFVATMVSAVAGGRSPLNNSRSELFDRLSQWPYAVDVLGEWWRVFTAAFLHIGPVHLALNMIALLIFGAELQRRTGPWGFLAIYLISLLGSAATTQLFGDPMVAVAGASGAIYGLLGALAVLMVTQRQDVRGVLTMVAVYVVFSFLPGIALLGHLGGLVAGAVTAGTMLVTRRTRLIQAVAMTCLAVLLVAVAVTAQTVTVLGS